MTRVVLLIVCALSLVAWFTTRGLGEETAKAVEAVSEAAITDADREHWAFQPVRRPDLPLIKNKAWLRTPVDAFILAELERKQLAPSPPALRHQLIRRLMLDLVGLPPTPQQLEHFLSDEKPNAYERLVDRVLSSPAYGERWAQHWLDLARFAETDGFEHDKTRNGAWQYRQWVINALNRDLPYDEFIRMQLIGDQSGRPSDAIATMFCLAGPDMPDINEQDLRRHDKLNEITSTVGAVILGLQMHCAQCHDHKYDPISQADFYRLRGVFESSIPAMKRDRPVTRLQSLKEPVSPWLYHRGDLSQRGPRVDAQPPRIASLASTQFDSARPRRAFASWLFSADNPLTSRVIANRIWQFHFAKSLTENPSDFGVLAPVPTHQELLDWLASELRENEWNLKRLHRLIVLSATYRQGGRIDDTEDPNNLYYSRFPRRRLEGETIRDCLLAVSGQLNRESGGPSVMPPLPPELLQTLLRGQWKTSTRLTDQHRRSIYVFARRNLRYPIFEAFDRPDAGASCSCRDQSTTATQALYLLNSNLAFDAAKKLRDRVLNSLPADERTPAKLIERLFWITYSRQPSSVEQTRLTKFLDASNDLSVSLLTVCSAILNANEFVYID